MPWVNPCQHCPSDHTRLVQLMLRQALVFLNLCRWHRSCSRETLQLPLDSSARPYPHCLCSLHPSLMCAAPCLKWRVCLMTTVRWMYAW
jgi:hypothetical protein